MSMLDMEASMAANVHLTPELASSACACVDGGLYNNVSEVVRSGLRLLKEQEDRKRAFDDHDRPEPRGGRRQGYANDG